VNDHAALLAERDRLRAFLKIIADGKHGPHCTLLTAQANYDTRAPGWCRCVEGLPGLPKRPPQAYYRDQTSGYHGWMCCTCRKITQTG
jgi:hypothetical protein